MMSDKLIAIHKHTDNRNRGYTLMEVLIAIAIFSIGFLAVGSMQIMAMRTGVSSRNQTTVLSIAKDRAEELEALPYTHADLAGSAAPGTTHAPAADVDGIDNNENGIVDTILWGPDATWVAEGDTQVTCEASAAAATSGDEP